MEPATRDPLIATSHPPRRGTRRLSLRARLVLLVVASLVPLIAFTLDRRYVDYQEAIASSARQTLELARSMSFVVETELKARIAMLQVLALSPLLRDDDFDGFRTLAETVAAEQFPGSNIIVLRADGQQLMNTLVPRGAALPVRPNLETTRQVFATGQPAVSNLYQGAVGPRPVVAIDVPVKRKDGSIAYVLSMNPRLDAFADVIHRQGLTEGWVASVSDRLGVTVARNLYPERFVGKMGGPGLVPRLLAEADGTLVETSRDGFRVVAAFSHAAPYGWSVTIGVPLAQIAEPAVQSALRTLAVAGIMLVIGLILALVVARQIVGPMAMLRRLAADARRDELLTAPPTGLREADEVMHALRLAETERRASEARVLDRGKQLESANAALESEVAIRRQAEQKAQAQLERLNLLHQITRAVGERQDLNSIFQVVVRSLEDELPVDFACLCLYDAVDHVLTVACIGVKSGALALDLAMPERARIDIDENGLSRCVQGRLVYEPDLAGLDFPFPRRLAGGGLRAMVLAPLQVESQVFGVLVVARGAAHSFSSGECEFLRQLSEHVALAAHQAQLYGALQQAYEDLRQTQQAVLQQERLRALGQMAGGIAHDINNALSPVALYTESLLETETNLSANARDYLETIQRAIDDVAHTIGRMEEFYRQREPQLTLTPVALNRLVQQVIDLTRARWSDMPMQRGTVIAMRTELAADLPAIAGVESEIREALTNLILNAVDALPNGGSVTLRTRREAADDGKLGNVMPGNVVVEVADDGAGMDEETRRRCLEPFFTTKGERGTGLGLAMVYGVVRRHNAEIDIASAPGMGTTVRLSFPVPTSFAGPAVQNYTGFVVPARLRLLLVDDDPLLLKSLRDTLEGDGHVVVTADDGQAGIATFRAAHARGEIFAAIITDLGMPTIDGRKVASAVKETSPATPVILLTGWGQRLRSDDDIPQHVDRVLSKPPKLREVREALAALCRPASG